MQDNNPDKRFAKKFLHFQAGRIHDFKEEMIRHIFSESIKAISISCCYQYEFPSPFQAATIHNESIDDLIEIKPEILLVLVNLKVIN